MEIVNNRLIVQREMGLGGKARGRGRKGTSDNKSLMKHIFEQMANVTTAILGIKTHFMSHCDNQQLLQIVKTSSH